MKLWQELVSTAIVGTERREFIIATDGDDRLTSVLQSIERSDNETVLLKTAGILGVYRRTGIKTIPDKQHQIEIAATETAKQLNEQTAQHLAGVLAGNHVNVLEEFMHLIAKYEQVLPLQFLPEILDLGSSRRDLRALLLLVIGERGRWLAKHNSSWRWALIEKNAKELWDSGNRDERLFAFEFWRRQNSAEARQQLANDWKSESVKDRAAFLGVLRTNLSAADEPFLDEVLRNDKSVDVRRIAFNLLAHLPGSRLVQELITRARKIIEFKKGGIFSKSRLEVNLPENFDKLEKDDVLNNCVLQLNQGDLGLKAVNLTKLLSVVSPVIWEKEFSATPSEITEASKSSDWYKALFAGFGFAAERYQNLDWLKEIIRLTYRQTNQYYPFYSNQWGMPENLPADLIEELFFELGGEDLVFPHLHKSQWSDKFTRQVVDVVKKGKRKTKEEWNNLRSYAYGLKDFAFFMSVDLNDELKTGWKYESDEDRHLESYINQFLDVLQFRQEIHDSFQEK